MRKVQIVTVPALKDADTATDQAKEALRAMADGEISVNDAGVIIASIVQRARIAEFDEFERRLEALEAGAGKAA